MSTTNRQQLPAKRKPTPSPERTAKLLRTQRPAAASTDSTLLDVAAELEDLPSDFFSSGTISAVEAQDDSQSTTDGILNVYCSGKIIWPSDAPGSEPEGHKVGDVVNATTELQVWEQSDAEETDRKHSSLDLPLHQSENGLPIAANTLESLAETGAPASATSCPGPVVATAEPTLCPEQAEVVQLVMEGANAFITGSAGCGKSTVVKAFTSRLTEKGKQVDIVAPTGIAALNVGGTTIHTYASLNLMHENFSLEQLKKYATAKRVRRKLKLTDVLVIDEISMVENFFFERLNAMLKSARSSPLPFGGIQLIVTGDFFQLPPVKPFAHCMWCGTETKLDRAEDRFTCAEHGTFYDEDKWAFKSNSWAECQFTYRELKTIHRQTDEVFVKILQKLRLGTRLTPEDSSQLLDPTRAAWKATELHPTREEVRQVNQAAFDKLRTEKYTYNCLDYVERNEWIYPHLKDIEARYTDGSLAALKSHRLERTLELKKGMIVILLANLDLRIGLCNGSQGIIVDFEEYDPSTLARPKGHERQLTRWDAEDQQEDHTIMKESQVYQFMDRAYIKKRFWPVVLFHNGQRQTVTADCSIEHRGDKKPYIVLSRTQIPLIPGWAQTIHKSQGQTLEQAKVNLSRAWEDGQVYVACSRSKSLKRLRIEGGGEGLANARANDEVKKFYRQAFPESWLRS